MKKPIFILAVVASVACSLAQAAVNVKKAAPVATKKADTMESATSLLPGVIGLVSNVSALNKSQQELSAECDVTSDEISTVNNLVKEWAKIGVTDASSAVSGLGEKCPNTYQNYMEFYAEKNETCYEVFENDSADKGMVWEGFPKAASAKKCDDNNKNCKSISNLYDIFVKIPFGDEDYSKSEWNKVAKLKEKAEKCAPAKIQAAKRELYGGFVVQTLGSIGQSTGAAGTASVLDAVSSLGGSGDIKSMLPSLGQMAMQTLDK